MKVTLPNQKQVFVDGFHEPSNTIFEFLGCNFHGCVKCHPQRRHIKRYCHPDRTVDEVYEATLKKINQLQAAGFHVKVMWECDYLKARKENPQLKEFVNTFELVSPLEPRDAFFGGRTEAITLYANAQDDETITYIDYTSLYPSINKYGLYPTGFPHILFNPDDQDIFHYFGIAKVDIHPNDFFTLYYP